MKAEMIEMKVNVAWKKTEPQSSRLHRQQSMLSEETGIIHEEWQ